MKRLIPIASVGFAAMVMLGAGLAARAPQATTTSRVAAARPVDYNWDVRPILSENCFRCHGPDEKSRMAGLRLDIPEIAYAELKSGNGKHAITPGNPDGSELIRRVSAENPASRMPPRSINKVLSPAQIDILKRWIAQGAVYKPHWAFITPEKPAPPAVASAARIVNEIDRFILNRLEAEGLRFSAEADKETLINRVTLTLTGLPPTLADVDAFIKDNSRSAYERVVDRLLATPAYGEHMAAYWMNIARYSESDGFLDDYHDRLFWPYRDWVIAAFNRNMPFDQFSTWQLAGDLMPGHTKEQTLATAFLRVGKRTTENGALDEEYRVEYAVDRANTVGIGFLGMTVGCARCHDHKYDPIPQKDFYALTGFFNSTDEPGFYAPGSTGITAGPTLSWTDAATEARLEQAEARIREQERVLQSTRAAAARDVAAKADALINAPTDLTDAIRRSLARGLVAHYPFEETAPIPDDQLPKSLPRDRRPAPPPLAPATSARNPFAARPAAAVEPVAPGGQQPPAAPAAEGGQTGRPGAGGRQGGPGRQGGAGTNSAGTPLTGEQQLAVVRAGGRGLPSDLIRDALVWSPSSVSGVGPAVLETPLLRPGVKGKAFYFDDTNRGFLAADVGLFERTQPFSLDLWVLAAQLYDDSMILNHRENDNSGNAGYQLDLEKNRLRFDLMHSRAGNRIRVMTRQSIPLKQWTHVTATYDGSSQAKGVALYLNGVRADVDVISDNLNRTIIPNGGGTLGDEHMGLSFGKRFRMTALKDGAIDELRVFKTALTPLEVRYLQDDASPQSPDRTVKAEILELLIANDPRVGDAAAALSQARDAQNQIISRVPEVMVMGDTRTPRPTYVLLRGQYTDHGEQVRPRGLSQIFPWSPTLPENRIGLTEWLFDPKNPLTARVFVNRLWQQDLGRGLVETSEDFGAQGATPSHPELLDWLAVTFRESGWDIKRMQKLIVMSATYRQSSLITKELLEKDPRNVLLARATRVRMPAEMVRDNALAASGLLVNTIGGPSTYPYQPDTIWDGLANYVYPAADRIPADDHHRRTLYSFVKRNAPHPGMATFDFPDRGTTTVRRQTSNTPLQALVLLDDPQYLEAYRVLATHVLKETADQDARITRVFRLATRRRPTAAELTPIRAYYAAELRRYSKDTAAAAALVKIGVTPVDDGVDKAQLAALMNVTAAIMNTPDAYSLR
jgi:Protein of unknown function (DUF1553)/Protein of unknown function (DUF1549)/Concanavalin A-like lectin/glucanases superfamily/Planctomycete cytochrome C